MSGREHDAVFHHVRRPDTCSDIHRRLRGNPFQGHLRDFHVSELSFGFRIVGLVLLRDGEIQCGEGVFEGECHNTAGRVLFLDRAGVHEVQDLALSLTRDRDRRGGAVLDGGVQLRSREGGRIAFHIESQAIEIQALVLVVLSDRRVIDAVDTVGGHRFLTVLRKVLETFTAVPVCGIVVVDCEERVVRPSLEIEHVDIRAGEHLLPVGRQVDGTFLVEGQRIKRLPLAGSDAEQT